MNNKTLKSVLVKVFFIIVLLVALWFVIVWDSSVKSEQAAQNQDEQIIEDEEVYTPDTILARKSFAGGSHTVEGVISLPTPCHSLDVSAVVAESFPEQVTLDFTISQPDAGTGCIQVIDEREFRVDFSASENASIDAKVNGQVAEIIFEQSK